MTEPTPPSRSGRWARILVVLALPVAALLFIALRPTSSRPPDPGPGRGDLVIHPPRVSTEEAHPSRALIRRREREPASPPIIRDLRELTAIIEQARE